MELQEQEKDMRAAAAGGPLSFGHLAQDSPSADNNTTRRDGNHNYCTQNLDHQPYLQEHQQRNISPTHVSHRSSFKNSSSKAIATSSVRYRECLRNHAASVGGNALDGCGEFMPSGEEGTLEALKCAACDCHRNFHRKEVAGDHNTQTQYGVMPRRSLMVPPTLQLPPPPLPPSTMLHHQNYSMVTPMSVAYGGCSGGGGGGTESSSEELNVFPEGMQTAAGGGPTPPPFALSKKRFRTKFTQGQKDKMMEFAEELGWKFLRQDDEKIDKFCAEIGVKRQVLKVWMHNNKNSAKKQVPPL